MISGHGNKECSFQVSSDVVMTELNYDVTFAIAHFKVIHSPKFGHCFN